MLRSQSFSGIVAVTSPKRPGKKPFRDLAKGVGKTLSRGQWVANDHIEDILMIKSTETDNVKQSG